MNDSLLPYLELKIHPLLQFSTIKEVDVIGDFNRSEGISWKEKQGKLFNFMRPTVIVQGEYARVHCFPGWDYVFHFSNIIKSFYSISNLHTQVNCILPTEQECWRGIESSSLQKLPFIDTIIMGNVEGISFISADEHWQGQGEFLWKICQIRSGSAILLGCKHTYWGEIAGRIVSYLSQRGAQRIIYSGKLGSLDPLHIPNQSLATGDVSLLPNGTSVNWHNMFNNLTDERVNYGTHITVPSVLQETVSWIQTQTTKTKFVDPEIGHMAQAAAKSGIEFAYLHTISDNLARKYLFDLSNERRDQVLTDRRKLYQFIGNAILNL